MVEKAVVTPLISPEDWVKIQLGNLTAVGEANYRKKIAIPRADPILRGIETETKYAEAVKKAIEEKRRKKALEATNIEEWYKYASEIGAGRLVEGVTKRENEVRKFVQPWQPILLEHITKVRELPEVTDKEREERMLQNLRGLKALKGNWRGATA